MNPQFATESIQSAAATFAVGRLIYLRLTHRFPALLAFLTLFALSAGMFAVMSTDSPSYFWLYILYLPVQNILIIIAVRELFTLVFNDYPGIQTIGRWAMYAGIVLSVTASLVIARVFWRGGAGSRDSVLFYMEVFQRSVIFSVAVIIVTILFVLSRYPLHLSRNTLLSSLFFSLMFLSDALRLLIDSMAPGLYNRFVDWPESFIIAALLSVWASLLKAEPATVAARVNPSTPHETQLLDQLNSLNAFLGSAGRR